MMREDYVIDLELIENTLRALFDNWGKAVAFCNLRDFEETKKHLADLGGNITIFDREVAKLLLPNPILKLRGREND